MQGNYLANIYKLISINSSGYTHRINLCFPEDFEVLSQDLQTSISVSKNRRGIFSFAAIFSIGSETFYSSKNCADSKIISLLIRCSSGRSNQVFTVVTPTSHQIVTLNHSAHAEQKTAQKKSEIRNPKSEGGPKSEIRNRSTREHVWTFRTSDFETSFDFRFSIFGFNLRHPCCFRIQPTTNGQRNRHYAVGSVSKNGEQL